MRSTCARVLAVLTLLTAHAARGDRPWVVGEFGDFSQIEFQGNDSFSHETLVAALDGDFGMLKASRPLATLAMLLSTIQTELSHGYRHSGFPDATVTADFDEAAQHVVIDIVEGLQFLNGPIIVQGVDLNLQQLLVERLSKVEPTVPTAPPQNASAALVADAIAGNQQQQALWVAEKPTSFEPFTASELERLSLEALHEAGYLDAQVRVGLEPDRVLRVTRLNIAVTPGTAASIGRIEITGLQRHTAEEIEKFLGIEVGQSCDLFARRDWEQQLEASGRFATHAITTTPMVDQPGSHVVRIELSECEDVPTLNEELNEIDLALLRAAEWLAHPPSFGGDIRVHGEGDLSVLCGYFQATPEEAVAADPAAEIEAPIELPAWLDGATASFDLALSPRGDSVLATNVASADGETLFGYGFEFTSDRIGLYSTATANCIMFDNESGPLPSATITFIRTPTSPTGDKYSVMFGFGVSSESGGVLQIRVTPAFMLTQAHSEGATFEIRDGVLHAEWDGVRSQFEVATGRLIRCECLADNGSEITIEIKPFGVQPVLPATLLRNGASGASYNELSRSLSPELACGTFLAEEAAWWASRFGNVTESSRWEAVSRLLRNLDPSHVETVSFTTVAGERQESTFNIPASAALAANPLAWAGQFVLWGNTAVLSRGTPAWQVGREAVALLTGDVTAFVELERLSRDERCGPLTSLYAAELTRFLHPALHFMWADHGRRRVDTDSLQRDLDAIISSETAVGRLLIELAAQAGRLPEDELRAVFAGIGNEWLDQAITVVTDANQTPEDRIKNLMQILWSAGLQERVEQRLSHHAWGNKEPTTP